MEHKEPTEEEKKKQEEAAEQLAAIMGPKKPKNFAQGATSGVGVILGGAVGGAGIAVLAPTAGLAMGVRGGGLVGGAIGLTGGAVIGVLAGAGLVVGGAVVGVTQMVKGVIAQPEAMTAPGAGKWWNESESRWVYTDLPKDLEGTPDNDDDILGDLEKEVDASARKAGGEVVDPYYYEVLEIDPKAEPSAIKRKYYVLARKYHPDKLDKDDKEGADKFKEIAEAYQVLSDPELRAKYDRDGRGGLSADKTEVAQDAPKLDPALLFAFLFGSDKFDDYVGRVAVATSFMVGDSPKVTKAQAREIQKRRVTRLAGKLATKLQKWTEEDYDLCKTLWATEAQELASASFGLEMVRTIGKIYCLAAVHFIGSLESGLGLPSVSKWAKAQQTGIKKRSDANKNTMEQFKGALNAMKIQQKYAKELEEAKTDEAKAEIQARMEKELTTTLLQIMWTTTVVDITSTLFEVCQMVFFDQSVDKETRQKRAYGVKNLGEIFMECPAPPVPEGEEPKDAQKLYEEAAFAAMLETVQRKDEAAFGQRSS